MNVDILGDIPVPEKGKTAVVLGIVSASGYQSVEQRVLKEKHAHKIFILMQMTDEQFENEYEG